MEKTHKFSRRVIALDIGGTLTKLAFTLPHDPSSELKEELEQCQSITGTKDMTRIYLRRYRTDNIQVIIEFIKSKISYKLLEFDLLGEERRIYGTGGGAYKYEGLLKSALNADVVKVDEMKSIQAGLLYILHNVKDSIFSYEDSCKYFQGRTEELLPLLMVNIGSGVSMVKVSASFEYERVFGSMIGGGTLMGLSNMLLGIDNFDALLELSKKGDNSKVDMMVKDLYGEDTNTYGLEANVISSSFGKVAQAVAVHRDKAFEKDSKVTIDQAEKFLDADLAKALVVMIAGNIAHLTALCARIHKLKRVMFTGNYIQNRPVNMTEITKALRIWSKDTECLFLKYDGYLGSIGSIIESLKTT